jgi:hypothetical protein
MRSRLHVVLATALLALLVGCAGATKHVDPLPSWNDGAAKQSIVSFVHATTDKARPTYVEPADRIATFDNDGTLWVEQPIYTQVTFAMDRLATVVAAKPELKDVEPFKSILTRDRAAMEKFTIQDFEKVVAVTHSGMTVEEFRKIVNDWLATAKHPRFKRPYTQCIYQPMLEVMEYLRENGFKTYIVTGGGQDFVRAFSQRVYGVPTEQVMGSAGKVKYEIDKNGKPVLVKLPEVLLIDDKAGKPEGINLIIGKRPIAAFGNSTGDREMLEYTGGPADGSPADGKSTGARLMMLVHHDDAEREYAYGVDSKIGTFPDTLLNEANERKWTIISMKIDWKNIFAPEK